MNAAEQTEKGGLRRGLILFLAQGAWSGRSPFAPGTAGTMVAVFLYLLLAGLPAAWYLSACAAVTGIAIWIADEAERMLGRKDDGSIVIDEIAGYLVSMALVPAGWLFIAAGFFLFRVFDIIKPFPARRLQDLHGGPGIVLDDIAAGVYTNIVLRVIWHFTN